VDSEPAAERGAVDPVDPVDIMDAPALNDAAGGEATGEGHGPGAVPCPNDTEGVEFELPRSRAADGCPFPIPFVL